MNNEGLNCVDMEQSDGGDDVELNEAAAPSLNLSIMSDTVFNVFKILVSRFEVWGCSSLLNLGYSGFLIL